MQDTNGTLESELLSGDLLAFFHDDGRFLRNTGERTRFQVFATRSTDGGLTWSEPWVVTEHPDADLCEPGLVVSPDGSRIALLLRENSRTHESFVVFLDDDGETWSAPRELPSSPINDRHTARYAPDGRLVVTFRSDGTLVTTTYGHWTRGEEPYVVSVRFRLEELDERTAVKH
ncbi:MAG TPA: sialidase family protein [Gemmatimonadota bacterium]|nr:sialidase family protein [Gemmatimonadota bacterium]